MSKIEIKKQLLRLLQSEFYLMNKNEQVLKQMNLYAESWMKTHYPTEGKPVVKLNYFSEIQLDIV